MFKSLLLAAVVLFASSAFAKPAIPVNMYFYDKDYDQVMEILTCELAFVSQDFRETNCDSDDCLFTVNTWNGTISCPNDGSPFVLKVRETETIDRHGRDDDGNPYTIFESSIEGAYRGTGSISMKNIRVTNLFYPNTSDTVCTDRRDPSSAVVDYGDEGSKFYPQICVVRK